MPAWMLGCCAGTRMVVAAAPCTGAATAAIETVRPARAARVSMRGIPSGTVPRPVLLRAVAAWGAAGGPLDTWNGRPVAWPQESLLPPTGYDARHHDQQL